MNEPIIFITYVRTNGVFKKIFNCCIKFCFLYLSNAIFQFIFIWFRYYEVSSLQDLHRLTLEKYSFIHLVSREIQFGDDNFQQILIQKSTRILLYVIIAMQLKDIVIQSTFLYQYLFNIHIDIHFKCRFMEGKHIIQCFAFPFVQ